MTTNFMFGAFITTTSQLASFLVIWLQSKLSPGRLINMGCWLAGEELPIDASDSGTPVKCRRLILLKLVLKSAI